MRFEQSASRRQPRSDYSLPPKEFETMECPEEANMREQQAVGNNNTTTMIPKWSLRQYCLQTVKQFLSDWSKSHRDSPVEEGTENPFQDCPIHVRQDLLDTLMQRRSDSRALLQATRMLIEAGIEDFDLRYLDDCKYAEICNIVEVLVQIAPTLRRLTLAGHWLYKRDSQMSLKKLLASARNLRELTLQHTTQGNRELITIARRCPQLRRLEIMHPSVNETELEELARVMESDPQCDSMRENLRELHLPSSVRGRALLLALAIFPNVDTIHCSRLEDALDELDSESDQALWRERLSRVRVLHVTHPMSEDATSRIVEWFPALEEISMEVQEGMQLMPLSQLPRLYAIELRNNSTLPAAYTDEVLPALAACGGRITHLSLEQFDVIDLAKTALYCPHLKALSAQWFTILGSPRTWRVPNPFSELRYIRLRPRSLRTVPTEPCETILANCTGLTHLELYCCYGLDDVVAERIIRNNPLCNLRALILRHGHGLTTDGVHTIAGNAQNLSFWDVGQVKRGPKGTEAE